MILSFNKIDELEIYLKSKGWMEANEVLTKVEKPGEGNMNFTMRVYTSHRRTFIVKQSRDYVEKYPTIPAPANRAVTEGRFIAFIQQNSVLSSFMPHLLGLDDVNNIIVTEDLGLANDYAFLYNYDEKLSVVDLTQMVEYLSHLHHSFRADSPVPQFANREMRALNHEHIFLYPLMEENGFDLDNVQQGLQLEAMLYKKDEGLKTIVKILGDKYLADGPYLLHGDYYPGSFLKTNSGVKVIDPEFCFYGFAEFDLGVFIAHLKMTEQSQDLTDVVLLNYKKGTDFDEKLLNQFVGVEILRRIIGLAQLPLSLSLETKKELLNEAKCLIMNNV
jgi:5-methylthioribose kinase